MDLPEIPPFSRSAFDSALARQDTLTKPSGSLGKLEQIAGRVAGIQGSATPRFRRKYAVIAAADHGVAAEGVSAYPQAVTAQMVANFLNGGAAINVLAQTAGVELVVIDAGVASELPADDRVRRVAVAKGTDNFARAPAMSRADAETMLEHGIVLANELCAEGQTAVVPGEMGIGNTTAAAAITSVIVGAEPRLVTGRGTGVDEISLRKKVSVVERAIELNRPDPADGLDVLAKVGGFEIGFLAGLMLGAASSRALIVLDGFISTSAALVANTLDGRLRDFMIAGHCSVEPGHRTALSHLQLEPLLDLDMQLGEGTGGVLALSVIESALALHNGMATFAEASVSGPGAGE